MKQVPIRFVKKNDFFKFAPNANLWVKDHYARDIKKFAVHKYEDTMHEIFIKPTKIVWVED